MAKKNREPQWQRAIIVLSGVIVGGMVVAFLFWAQAVLIPVALAVFLTFVLTPVVEALERRRVPRVAAVLTVVLTASLILGTIGWIATRQVLGVLDELPNYSASVKEKIQGVRSWANSPTTKRLNKVLTELSHEFDTTPPAENKLPPDITKSSPAPTPVVVQPQAPGWLGRLTDMLSSVGETLASLGLIFILVIFMLLEREGLRNRLIRLVGQGRITSTTKAVDDAATRMSRFLLMQLFVNGSYGLALGLGLLALGVPYAILWGFLAAVLRYVPYVGPWIAAVPPVVLAAIVFPGWTQPLLVAGWIIALELVSNNVIEPRLYGQSIGVSEVALLIAAAFWAFLWGPIGLVLSSPLTVCLVVLGKYVPQLEFLDILMGDQPALEPHVTLYQRLLAHDMTEATNIVAAQAKTRSTEEVYEHVLLPVVSYVKRDRAQEELGDDDEEFIFDAIRKLIEQTDPQNTLHIDAAAKAAAAPPKERQAPGKARLIAVPSQDAGDALALEMLVRLLDLDKWDIYRCSIATLAAELVEIVGEQESCIVAIAAVPPGGTAQTRYLCKRLRSQYPELQIVVGRWGGKGRSEGFEKQLREDGANEVHTSLDATYSHLSSWLPVLTRPQADPHSVNKPSVTKPSVTKPSTAPPSAA